MIAVQKAVQGGASFEDIQWVAMGLKPVDYLKKLGDWADAEWLVKAAEYAKKAAGDETQTRNLGGRATSSSKAETEVSVSAIRLSIHG